MLVKNNLALLLRVTFKLRRSNTKQFTDSHLSFLKLLIELTSGIVSIPFNLRCFGSTLIIVGKFLEAGTPFLMCVALYTIILPSTSVLQLIVLAISLPPSLVILYIFVHINPLYHIEALHEIAPNTCVHSNSVRSHRYNK